jgi:hypothetical protein
MKTLGPFAVTLTQGFERAARRGIAMGKGERAAFQGTGTCSTCGKRRPLDAFYKQIGGRAGLGRTLQGVFTRRGPGLVGEGYEGSGGRRQILEQ